MNNPLVSVIIPAYNHEKYIQDTINSIINQTYSNIELIIIDDGSKDLTWQKINEMKEECQERFVRINFSTRANKGTCATYNELLEKSSGEYVYLIASDDLAKPESIEVQVQFLNEYKDYALVVGDNEIIDSSGKVCFWDKNQNTIYDKKKAVYATFASYLQKTKKINFKKCFGKYQYLYYENHVPNGYLIRKSIFDIIGNFTQEAPLEDWWMVCQISKYAKMKYIDKILFSYRWHESNTMQNLEKVRKMAECNQKCEGYALSNVDIEKALPEIKKMYEEGIIYNVTGIPFLFSIIKCKKGNNKLGYLKFLGLKFLLYKK